MGGALPNTAFALQVHTHTHTPTYRDSVLAEVQSDQNVQGETVMKHTKLSCYRCRWML